MGALISALGSLRCRGLALCSGSTRWGSLVPVLGEPRVRSSQSCTQGVWGEGPDPVPRGPGRGRLGPRPRELGLSPSEGAWTYLKEPSVEEFGSILVSSGGRVISLSMVMGCMGHSPSQGEAGMAPALRSWE